MKSRSWFLLSLLLLLAAGFFWRLGEQRRLREQPSEGATNAPARLTVWERFIRLPSVLTGRTPSREARPASPQPPELLSLSNDPRLPFRLRNSPKKEAEFFRSETAVLLRNALVETLEPVSLNIPAHLRAQGDPGSYLVQARGMIDQNFRDVLRGAGAEVVSYVPNNTYLVRASAAVAQQVRVSPRVQSVLPFEPYYKLDMTLLPLAVRREAMPADRWLNLVLFAGTQEKAKADLRALGAEVKAEQRFPFGHVVTIAPRADSLVALAQLPAVQNIEAYHSPILMNDLSRVRLNVSTDTTTPDPGGNWLGLTGSGVTVGVNGSGVDLAHPQLSGRTFVNAASPTIDTNGHDTFIAGVIVANHSTTPTPTNGSINGASYRGIAPGALVYPLSLYSDGYANYGNTWLITNAPLATNIHIVNNSWGYPVFGYDINSALFDEAVRDSLPFRTNDQPVTHVFAAGNSGGANTGGTGGGADTIPSPGNGKNVITVGASELLRLVDNSTTLTNTGTNDPLANAHSDSDFQVADFSSRGNVGPGIEGPDGRFKPDLIAPGAYVASLRASTFTNVQESDAMLGSSQWRYESGTSVAAGKVSGLLALMQQFFESNFSRTNPPSMNKALLINRARSLFGAYDFAVNNPVTHQGWGIPSLSNTVPAVGAFGFLTNAGPLTRQIVIVDESNYVTNRLATGQFHAYDVTLPAGFTNTNTLKITLVWTDPAGNPVASMKLVNDLDLFVAATNNAAGFTNHYFGNNFAPGSLVTQPTPVGNSSARDSVNNVENVFISNIVSPSTTTHRVYVVGRKVNVNAVSADTNNVVQDYSLVISSDTPTLNVTVRPVAAPNFFAYTNRPANIITNGIPYLNERIGANFQQVTVNTNGVTNQWNFYVFTNQNLPPTLTNYVTNIVGGVTNITTNVVRVPITNGGPYAVFATFLPPNLSRARNREADIDLFIARTAGPTPVPGASGLTNLDPAVVSHANLLRSTNRGGYELVSLDNSSLGEIFYVGIKSEDKQAASYGFFAAAQPQPFGTNDTNGNIVMTLFPAPADIPDGTPEGPGGVTFYGICTTNIILRSISMSNTFVHENLGDLVGTLSHGSTFITLNNHAVAPGTNAPAPGLQTNNLVYDDFRNPPDGPGDVTDLLGQDGVGLWVFEVQDSSPFLTGRVDYATIYLTPYTNYSGSNGTYTVTYTLQSGQSFVDFIDVPSYATNMDVDIIGGLPAGPVAAGTGVDLFAGYQFVPAQSNYSDARLDLDSTDLLPHLRISTTTGATNGSGVSATGSGGAASFLLPGRWNFRVVNNTAGTLTLTNRYTLGLNLAVANTELYLTNSRVDLLDNYTTNLFFNVPEDRVITGVDVGLAIYHPRVSDLVIHLVSPLGTKVLLFEDRGGLNGLTSSNIFANFTENTNFTTSVDVNGTAPLGFVHLDYLLPIKFVPTPYSAVISPPRLMTNMTNTAFGYSNPPPFGISHEIPGGLAQFGQALFMAGSVYRTDGIARTNDAFVAAYQIPITNNLDRTNWGITNYWMGPFSGYRGRGSGALDSASTLFSGVAANADGVYAGGHTLNYFPPASQTWSGTAATRTFDVDLGSTNGSVQLTHITDAAHDRVVMQYQGLTVFDSTSLVLPAGPVNYIVTVPFSGASRFMRVTVNPTPLGVASTWTNSVTVLRSGGMEHAVTNFVRNDMSPSGFRAPATPPGYTAPVPQTLSVPRGVALDATGNVYVADSGNDRILRFSQQLPIFQAGTNGTYSPMPSIIGGVAGVLNNPGGVAVHPNGDIYVADTDNHQIRRFQPDGTEITPPWGDVLKTAGSENSGAVGFPNGRLNAPQGIAIGSDGIVYVADTGNNLIRIINGAALSTITMPAAFVAASGDLLRPRALAVQIRSDVLSANPLVSQDISQSARLGSALISPTTLYIADTDNHRIVQLMQSGATWVAIHLAGEPTLPGPLTPGRVDGANTAARFSSPSGITRDGYGNLYVSDAGSHCIRRITPLGDVVTIAGDLLGASGTLNANSADGLSARFNTPRGLVADHFGGLFVADEVNDNIRSVMPYQKVAPTNSFLAVLPFTGPNTNQPLIGTSSMLYTRAVTNSVFGVDLGEPSLGNHDFIFGVASSTERGSSGQTTNFTYAVGSAQFSTNPASVGYQRMFISKLDTNGQPIWTRGHMPAASIGITMNAALDITSFVIGSGGSGYAAAPVATLHDPLNPNPALRSISLTVSVAGGAVTGVTAPATPITGPFIAPRVYVEAPQTLHMPGNGVAVAYGTNVIAAGYTNQFPAAFTNNLPFLMCLDSNGVPRWATNSATGGHYSSVSVFGTNIIAVGAAYAAGAVGASNCLIERWDLNGNFQTSRVHTFAAGPSQLSSVLAIESLDRAYAVGTISNGVNNTDAFLMELDLVNLTVISVVINNLNFGLNVGKAIATDGADLYVAVTGPGDGTPNDAQAGIFRYRAKNFYLPEETLDVFAGQRTWAPTALYSNGVPVLGTNTSWQLQIADTRAGGTNGIAHVLAWNLNFSYAPTTTVSLAVAPGLNNNFTLLSSTPRYFVVNVPSAAAAATNLISASAPVRVTFNPAGAPVPGAPGNVEMFSGAATGSFVVSANSNAVARLRSGAQYYLRVEAMNPGPNVDLNITVNFDQTELPPPVTPLTSGVPVNSAIPRTATLNHYAFNVAAGSSAAMFEILSANGDVNLYLRRSNDAASFPSAAAFDYRSANPGTGVEQVFLVTNGASATALTPGIWFASVQNADNAPVSYSIRATAAGGTPYNVVTTTDGQLQGSVTSPGNAPNTMFKFSVPSAQKALLFEVQNLTGPGDLVVRKNGFPLNTTNDGANFRPDTLPELVTIRTNASLPSVVGDWYFGVLNPGAAHISYSVMARQPTNGVLLSSSPIQIVSPPGGGLVSTGTNFGFGLAVVPGEKYQVQYKTNVASASWLVLTNIVAPADGVISFVHSNALTNRNLYYRIQVVP